MGVFTANTMPNRLGRLCDFCRLPIFRSRDFTMLVACTSAGIFRS